MNDKKDVTVYDIAKEAGVSVATVSRVLNDSAPVRAKTKEKVVAVMEKHNFQPNALARSLSKKKTKTIGFILPDITNPFFSEVYVKAEKAALDLEYSMFLSNAMNDYDIESLYLKTLVEKQVDGIIFMGGRVNDTKTKDKYAEEMKQVIKKTPVVIINGQMEGVDCYSVRTNEAKSILKSLNYLISLGHQEIALVGGISGINSTDIKFETFKKYKDELGLRTQPDWFIKSGYSIEAGYKAFDQLLASDNFPSAVIAVNDFVGIGIIEAAKENKVNIPEELSVIGFDNIYLTKIINPNLTSLSHNYDQLAKKAVAIIDGVNNNKKFEKEIILDTELVIRESCAAAK